METFEQPITNSNVLPLHGRSLVKGILNLKVQQIQSMNIGKGTFYEKFFLEGTTDPNMILGYEVIIDKSVAGDPTYFDKCVYKRPYNPRDISIIKELIDGLPGKIANDLIVKGVKVEIWVYFLFWNNDIAGIVIDNEPKKLDESLIPELDEYDLTVKPKVDEPNMLKIGDNLTKEKPSIIIPSTQLDDNKVAGIPKAPPIEIKTELGSTLGKGNE